MKKLIVLLFISILVFSCEKDEGVLVPNDEQNVEIRAKKNNVQICHKLGNGQFNLIEVNGNAAQAHINHGDGYPGECFEQGTFMSEECIVVDVSSVPDVCDGLDNDCDGVLDEGIEEICNGVDDDCDGLVDEGLLLTCFADVDGDGYGDPNNQKELCACNNGYVANDFDCNDAEITTNPSAEEICGDGLDNDCDNQVDCDDPECEGDPACLSSIPALNNLCGEIDFSNCDMQDYTYTHYSDIEQHLPPLGQIFNTLTLSNPEHGFIASIRIYTAIVNGSPIRTHYYLSTACGANQIWIGGFADWDCYNALLEEAVNGNLILL